MIDFKKLGEVPQVEEVLDTDTVLVARDGEIYRVDKKQVGGGAAAGGYLLVPGEGEAVYTSSYIAISTPIDEMKAALAAGSPVMIQLDSGVTNPDMPGIPFWMQLIFFAEMEGEAIGYAWLEDAAPVMFTNGDPLPDATSEASATSLVADSASPLSTLRSKLGGATT